MNSFQDNVEFYKKLKEKESAAIHSEIFQFINKDFLKIQNFSRMDISRFISDFISKMINDFAKAWKISLNDSHNNYNEICEGLESIITKSLFSNLFQICRENDQKFEKIIKKLQGINLSQLDLKDYHLDTEKINLAVNKLNEMNLNKSPREKLMVVNSGLNILLTISHLIMIKRKEKVDNVKLLAYTLIKASIPNLKTNITYMQTFRHKSLISSEDDYFLKLLEDAVRLIETLNNSQVKVENLDEESRGSLINLSSNAYATNNLSNSNSSVNSNKSVGKDSTKLINERTSDVFNLDYEKIKKFYFSKPAGELTVTQLEALYSDFKSLLKIAEAIKYSNDEESNNISSELKHSKGENLLDVNSLK